MSLPRSGLAAQERTGQTEPRLFTPPLRELTPDTSWGFECISFLENVLRWTLLPWQKWLYIHALEKDSEGVDFRYQTIVLLIARQNGKTQWLKGLGLWKLYMDGAKQVLISAQNLEMAETTLSEVVADVRSNKLLRQEFRRFSQTNGKYKMVLKPEPGDPFDEPREWRAAVSSRKGSLVQEKCFGTGASAVVLVKAGEAVGLAVLETNFVLARFLATPGAGNGRKVPRALRAGGLGR